MLPTELKFSVENVNIVNDKYLKRMKEDNLLSGFGTPRQRVLAAIAAIREGRGVLLVDDENRENEGDLIFSAQKMTEKDMALMIRHCSGIVCLCITEEKAKKLNLPLMVEHNTSNYGTAFTISIEADKEITTGVSAADRMRTIRTAIDEHATPDSLRHPGHVFPLIARPGGIKERKGHTEGSIDLMKLAGLAPYAVLCELTNDDGTMSRLPEIVKFSKLHNYPVMSINDLKNYDQTPNFLPGLVGSFAKPAAENPTVAIMEAAFHHHGLHYRYINSEVSPDDLELAVNGAKAMGWKGFNCSIPNKVKVIQYLDEIGESAKIIGAVNTVIIGEDKRTIGENTDGKGFVKAISDVTTIEGKSIVLFGAGGAARAISVEMALAGAKKITILNIDDSGQELVELLNRKTTIEANFTLWNHKFKIPSDTDIVINATSVGLYPNVEQHLNIDPNTLLPHMVVADCIPNPAYTHLIKDALSRNCQHVLPGMNMLVNQAIIAVKYWTGMDVNSEIMMNKLKSVLRL